MKAEVDYISSEIGDFEKDGQKIEFQRVTFIEREEGAVPLTVTADKELDFSDVPRYVWLTLDINLVKNNNGYLRAKVVGFERHHVGTV